VLFEGVLLSLLICIASPQSGLHEGAGQVERIAENLRIVAELGRTLGDSLRTRPALRIDVTHNQTGIRIAQVMARRCCIVIGFEEPNNNVGASTICRHAEDLRIDIDVVVAGVTKENLMACAEVGRVRLGHLNVEDRAGDTTRGIGSAKRGISIDTSHRRPLRGQRLGPPVIVRTFRQLLTGHQSGQTCQRCHTVREDAEDSRAPVVRQFLRYKVPSCAETAEICICHLLRLLKQVLRRCLQRGRREPYLL